MFCQMLFEALKFRVNTTEKTKKTIGRIIPNFVFAFLDKTTCSHTHPTKRHIKIMTTPIQKSSLSLWIFSKKVTTKEKTTY